MTNSPLPPRLRPLFAFGVAMNWAMVLAGPLWAVPQFGEAGWLWTGVIVFIAVFNTWRLFRQRWEDS